MATSTAPLSVSPVIDRITESLAVLNSRMTGAPPLDSPLASSTAALPSVSATVAVAERSIRPPLVDVNRIRSRHDTCSGVAGAGCGVCCGSNGFVMVPPGGCGDPLDEPRRGVRRGFAVVG